MNEIAKNLNKSVFFHIGLMKTGTTTIQDYLNRDQRINLILKKKYFNTNQFFYRKYDYLKDEKINIESDEQLFTNNNYYSGSTVVLQRIKEKFPDAKIILTTREQRSLLLSAFKHTIKMTDDYYKSFEEFLNSKEGHIYMYMCDFDHIYKQINNYFPKENINILLYEDLRDDYNAFFNRLYNIFGLDNPRFNQLIESNKSWPDALLMVKIFLNKIKIFKKGRRIISISNSNYNQTDEFKLLYRIEKYVHSAILKISIYVIKNIPKLMNYRSNLFTWKQNDFFYNLKEFFKLKNKDFVVDSGIDLGEHDYL